MRANGFPLSLQHFVMNNLVANLPFLFKQSNIEASCAVIRKKGQNVSQRKTKEHLKQFKHMAKYLAETTECDKAQRNYFDPLQDPKYFYCQLATVTTKRGHMDCTENYFPSRTPSSGVCQDALSLMHHVVE